MEKQQGEGGDARRDGGVGRSVVAEEEEPHVERLPADVLAHVLSLLSSFHDLAMAGGVSRRWRRAVERSLAGRRRLSFAGQSTGDDSTARFVRAAVNLRDLDISRSCWGCQITDEGLLKISSAECVGNLTSISLWGLAGITDKGVVHLVSRAHSLQHLNIGGTFITDESLYAVANSCANMKVALIYVVLSAVVLQRLPISFSQHSAGQLRNRKNSNSGGAKVLESGPSRKHSIVHLMKRSIVHYTCHQSMKAYLI